ncbi:MAG: Peroxisomal membrane protein PMP27 [Geoglossum simile]|nr:MAG: Peroxisomal membrane protein PMP27 [Geoglossum simile]
MLADALVYHPSVAHYLKFVATTIGRDKLLRTIQYFSRFYAWYLYRTNHPASQVKTYEAIKKQFGLTRKLMRVGKNVEHFRAAAEAAEKKTLDPVMRYCAIGRQLGYGMYLSLDSITYLDASGIKPLSAGQRIQRAAYKAWLVGLLFNTVAGVYTLYQLRQRERSIDKKDGESLVESKRLERERAVTNLQLISDLCDLTVPTSALGLTNFDDGFVGLTGTASSLIGLYGVWKKTA